MVERPGDNRQKFLEDTKKLGCKEERQERYKLQSPFASHNSKRGFSLKIFGVRCPLRRRRIPPPTAGPRQRRWAVMYSTYIIKSERAERYYVGSTANFDDRPRHHNSGATRSTRPYRPWKLVHIETFPTKKEAWLRERQIKRYKSGSAFQKLIHGGVA